MKRPWYTWTVVCLVCALMAWTCITYFYHLVVPLYLEGELISALATLLALLTAIVAISYSYNLCIKTDPGNIPSSWALKEGHTSNNISSESLNRRHQRQFIETDRNGAVRICRKCRVYKPDRSHHCSKCNKCVLKMDHHCIWFNNCIGFHNYKYFMIFLLYTLVSLTVYLLTIGRRALDAFLTKPTDPKFNAFGVNLFVNYLFMMMIELGVLIFLLYHIKLILFGTTTLESLEKSDKLNMQYDGNPYDLGYYGNWIAVFGKKSSYWFLPVSSVIGDGTHFHTLNE
ncbi:palmitoyltransferase [Acrasis kona]|uniref:Palmitoyltransferase n=1 Tax=Acrasis kona TaxID=1008807 RepID=A0AAW2YZ80_9EUKA